MNSLAESTRAAAAYWIARYDSFGCAYVARDGTINARELQVVAPMLEELIEPGGRILDFGSGDGRFREILERKAAVYDGVDLIPGLSTLDWDCETLPGGYDEVLAAFVLQHITDGEAYAHWVQQLHDCLKPGGILFVVEHEAMDELFLPREPHMLPRGMLAVLQGADWMGLKCLPVQYANHWFALFVKRPLELPTDPAPQFEKDEDGLVFARTVPMPQTISINRTVLDLSGGTLDGKGGGCVTRNGDEVDFRFANGRWVYRIIGWGGHGQDVAVAELEYSE